ncbi:MAG: hypothetical protein C0417_10780 [Chlorobiaceae bacterium]|nr:hypothetical protein [Chlorobiaceae bacterium]
MLKHKGVSVPKRPRQHELETESRNAFQAIITRTWLFRDMDQDYGIDGQVEIFDVVSKNSTGKTFNVQLKATDEKNVKKALAIRFPIDTHDYYHSLTIPVLIVRYHSPTKRIYVRWYHLFDTYYALKGKKGFTFNFVKSDRWDKDTPKKLQKQFDLYRQFTSAQISLPIKLSINFHGAKFHGILSGLVHSAVRKEISKLHDVISCENLNGDNVEVRIEIDNKKTVILIQGVGDTTLHTSRRLQEKTVLEKYPSDVLVGLGILLDKFGHSDIAARILSEVGCNSAIIKQREVLVRVLRCLSRTTDVTKAVELADSLFAKHGVTFDAELLLLPAYKKSLSAREREFLLGFMERRIQRVEVGTDNREKSIAHYNLGRYICHTEPLKAVTHYRNAAKYDPDYLKRNYFLAELGGIMFESGHFRFASRFYERAIDLGGENKYIALKADSLLFAGNYEMAENVFEIYLDKRKTIDLDDIEWVMKHKVIGEIRRITHFNVQKRDGLGAMRVFDGVDSKTSAIEQEKEIEIALNFDALCPLAWFNRGVTKNKSKEFQEAFISFLTTAVISRIDIEAWCNSIILGLNLKVDTTTISFILQLAYSIHGESFINEMHRIALTQPQGFPVAEFTNKLSDMVAILPKEKEPLEVRLLWKGSYFKKINLSN